MKSWIKNVLIGVVITFFLVGIHVLLYQLSYEIDDYWQFIKYSFLYNALYALPFYIINVSLYDMAKKREENSELPSASFWGRYLFFIIVINTILALVITIISHWIDGTQPLSHVIDVYFFLSCMVIATVIGVSFYGYYYLKAKFNKESQSQKRQIQQITQKHEALKTQIGPHFLFNSLNVVSGLIDENPEKAQDFIADLAQVYRYVLDQKDKEWVKLSEEIQFAHAYLDLVQTRFEDGLHIEIAEELNTSELMIAPITLQLLLENCIKHNAISKSQPLHIKIFEHDNQLIVQNNINPKKQLYKRKGSGLDHIRARYKSLATHIDVSKSETNFVVKIPLFTKDAIQMTQQNMFSEEEMKEAREEVKERLGFYANLGAYIIICSVLAGANLYHGGYFWAIWPIMGWGLGVLSHGLGVFYFNQKGTSGNNWEERQARKLLEKRKRGN